MARRKKFNRFYHPLSRTFDRPRLTRRQERVEEKILWYYYERRGKRREHKLWVQESGRNWAEEWMMEYVNIFFALRRLTPKERAFVDLYYGRKIIEAARLRRELNLNNSEMNRYWLSALTKMADYLAL